MLRLMGRIALVFVSVGMAWTVASAQTPSATQTFVIVGEVKAPGGKPWAPGMTVGKAVTLAEGITAVGSRPAIRIRRPVKGSDGVVRGYATVNNISDDTAVLADDTLLVGRFTDEMLGSVNLDSGEVPAFGVEGEINSPGLVLWEQGMTVGQAISAANGMTSKGKLGHIKRTIRDADGKVLRYETIKDLKPDTVLQQDDILVIARKWFGN